MLRNPCQQNMLHLLAKIEHLNHKTPQQSENEKSCSVKMGQSCTLLVSGAAHLIACNALQMMG